MELPNDLDIMSNDPRCSRVIVLFNGAPIKMAQAFNIEQRWVDVLDEGAFNRREAPARVRKYGEVSVMFQPGATTPDVLREVGAELGRAMKNWPKPFHNAHEGYGIIAEEWRELENHVFTNQKARDLPGMRMEAIQLAAMALRFVIEVCDGGRGRE